jgi:hypothetical protein
MKMLIDANTTLVKSSLHAKALLKRGFLLVRSWCDTERYRAMIPLLLDPGSFHPT